MEVARRLAPGECDADIAVEAPRFEWFALMLRAYERICLGPLAPTWERMSSKVRFVISDTRQVSFIGRSIAMPSRIDGMVFVLIGCIVAVVGCVILVGLQSTSEVDVSNLWVPGRTAPGSTAAGWAVPGSTASWSVPGSTASGWAAPGSTASGWALPGSTAAPGSRVRSYY